MKELYLFLRLSAPDVVTMYEQGLAAAEARSEDASSRNACVPVSGFNAAPLSSVAAQKNSRWPERLRRRRSFQPWRRLSDGLWAPSLTSVSSSAPQT